MDIDKLDLQYAALLKNECFTGDNEADHGRADDLLLMALRELGMDETANVYDKASANFWYA